MAYHTYERQLLDMILNTRAWCLQGRMLPVRTLYFTSTEVHWECYECCASESFPTTLPETMFTAGRLSLHKERLSLRLWPSIIHQYSKCYLTNPTDKLVAISGIAETISKLDGVSYVAGLWDRNLVDQLCWKIESKLVNTSNTSSPYQHNASNLYIAPSWSWLSIPQGVAVHPVEPVEDLGDRYSLLKVMDIRLAYLHGNYFGTLTAGSLLVSSMYLIRHSGPLRSIVRSGRPNESYIHTSFGAAELLFDYKSSYCGEGSSATDETIQSICYPYVEVIQAHMTS